MKKIWVTDSGIVHHRKPEMEATEYVEVTDQGLLERTAMRLAYENDKLRSQKTGDFLTRDDVSEALDALVVLDTLAWVTEDKLEDGAKELRKELYLKIYRALISYTHPENVHTETPNHIHVQAALIVSDADIEAVWGNANFGDKTDKREIILDTLFKYARGYSTGSTATNICQDLGLIKNYRTEKDIVWTEKGEEYIRALAQQQPDANKYNTLCKQCWEALGIKDYTGKHIAEHIRELQSALKTLVDLQSNQSGFEGEMFRDRVENAWYNARKLIERAEQKGGVTLPPRGTTYDIYED